MKAKKGNHQLTKKDIENIVKKQLLPLVRDIKLIRGETKELKESTIIRLGVLRSEISLTREEVTLLKVSFDDKFAQLDKIMGELQTLREEQLIHFGRHEEIEERVAKLEQPSMT